MAGQSAAVGSSVPKTYTDLTDDTSVLRSGYSGAVSRQFPSLPTGPYPDPSSLTEVKAQRVFLGMAATYLKETAAEYIRTGFQHAMQNATLSNPDYAQSRYSMLLKLLDDFKRLPGGKHQASYVTAIQTELDTLRRSIPLLMVYEIARAKKLVDFDDLHRDVIAPGLYDQFSVDDKHLPALNEFFRTTLKINELSQQKNAYDQRISEYIRDPRVIREVLNLGRTVFDLDDVFLASRTRAVVQYRTAAYRKWLIAEGSGSSKIHRDGIENPQQWTLVLQVLLHIPSGAGSNTTTLTPVFDFVPVDGIHVLAHSTPIISESAANDLSDDFARILISVKHSGVKTNTNSVSEFSVMPPGHAARSLNSFYTQQVLKMGSGPPDTLTIPGKTYESTKGRTNVQVINLVGIPNDPETCPLFPSHKPSELENVTYADYVWNLAETARKAGRKAAEIVAPLMEKF